MATKLVVSDHVAFRVRGVLTGESGGSESIDFGVTARRMKHDELQEVLRGTPRDAEFVRSVATGWRGVKDAEDRDVPFSAEGLDQLLQIHGVAALIARAYLDEVGARAKN